MAFFSVETFEAIEATPFAQVIRESTWIFPITEVVHLLALCALGGALLVVDLRLLGIGLVRSPVAELARESRKWLWASVAAMLATGTVLFVSEAVKCYHNPSFWVKMTALPLGIAWSLVMRRRLTREGAPPSEMAGRLMAVASMAVWFTVAAAGRWIGFSS
jgi:hypothetical protein